MNEDSKDKRDTEMRDEYDFSDGAVGKYAGRFSEEKTLIVLDPDVAEIGERTDDGK